MNAICDYIPRSLLLQWHITNRCNLRCAHCYQEQFGGAEPTRESLLSILSQFEQLLAEWRGSCGEGRVPAHITVTGGEPFARNDFMDLLGEFHARRNHFTFAILTNGTQLSPSVARRLTSLRPRFVQVSIEGIAETHDRIRGRGNYDQVLAAIRSLREARVRTFISFTAHRENFREFPEVARLGRSLGVDRVWTDRLIPSGSGAALDGMLSPAETREFFGLIKQARLEAKRAWFNRTEIAAHRALQFVVCGGNPYHCRAGDSLLTIMPNGDLYPCRRMPVRVGNVLETPLREIYYGSPLLRDLRDTNSVSTGCEVCCFRGVCRGGLRCLSYAVHGSPFKADPGCWLTKPSREGGEHGAFGGIDP